MWISSCVRKAHLIDFLSIRLSYAHYHPLHMRITSYEGFVLLTAPTIGSVNTSSYTDMLVDYSSAQHYALSWPCTRNREGKSGNLVITEINPVMDMWISILNSTEPVASFVKSACKDVLVNWIMRDNRRPEKTNLCVSKYQDKLYSFGRLRANWWGEVEVQ